MKIPLNGLPLGTVVSLPIRDIKSYHADGDKIVRATILATNKGVSVLLGFMEKALVGRYLATGLTALISAFQILTISESLAFFQDGG